MFDLKSEQLAVIATDFSQLNGPCFSPDKKKFYVSNTAALGGLTPRHTWVRVFNVTERPGPGYRTSGRTGRRWYRGTA